MHSSSRLTPNGFKYFNRAPIKTAMEGDLTQVICDSKHVSVTALVFLTGVVFSVHPSINCVIVGVINFILIFLLTRRGDSQLVAPFFFYNQLLCRWGHLALQTGHPPDVAQTARQNLVQGVYYGFNYIFRSGDLNSRL